MPTTRPRYTLTDTGELAEMLDLAARRWPDAPGRKGLLVRPAAARRDTVARELAEESQSARVAKQRRALDRVGALVDREVLEADAAWR